MPPAQPGYNGLNTNTGFIMKVNPANGAVLASQTINTNYATGNPYTVDYDMATRVYELFDFGLSQNVGNIFLTGSVNNDRNGARLATMNVKLDANLTTASVMQDHFSMGGPSGPLPLYEPLNDEMGMGVEYDPSQQGYAIVGNLVERVTTQIPSSQLNAYPRAVIVTYVDKNFKLPVGGRPRIRFLGFNTAWANHTLKSSIGICSNWSSGPTLRIAGFQSLDYPTCISPSIHNPDNVGPFFWHTELEYVGGNLQIKTFGKWTTYYTETGTGRESTSPLSNNFWRKGGGLSNPAFLPAFTAIIDTPGRPGSGKTSLATPVWNPNATSPGKLNNKAITTLGYNAWTLSVVEYTNDFQNDPTCVPSSAWSAIEPNPYTNPACFSGSYFPSLPAAQITTTTSPATPFNGTIVSSITLSTAPYGITADVCRIATNPHYRGENTVVANLEPTGKTNFYPNPTADYVQVSLAQDIADAMLKIVLVNVQGQIVANLYDGEASQLRANAKLNLPNVPAGIYMATLIANGKVVHQQKLSILP